MNTFSNQKIELSNLKQYKRRHSIDEVRRRRDELSSHLELNISLMEDQLIASSVHVQQSLHIDQHIHVEFVRLKENQIESIKHILKTLTNLQRDEFHMDYLL